MSIPADTPAAVTISPLSTNRSSGRTSTVGSSSTRRSSLPHQVVAHRDEQLRLVRLEAAHIPGRVAEEQALQQEERS